MHPHNDDDMYIIKRLKDWISHFIHCMVAT